MNKDLIQKFLNRACYDVQSQYELEDFKKGKWVQSEDVANNIKLIAALELLIPYYGGTV